MTDYLASLAPLQVAGWYRRLADRIATRRVSGGEPLASLFLRHWLENRDPNSTFRFAPPSHLRESEYVAAQLDYHREVFLTQQQARRTGGTRAWAGILPRLQGLPGFTRWDMSGPLGLEYESLVEVGSGIVDLVRIQQSGTAEERDLLTALRGFQLRSRVEVQGAPLPNRRVRITFTRWMARIRDRYDWDYSEHFTVPNPDFGSASRDAVRPGDQMLTVYHRNAQRIEQAGLAAPYNVESDEWPVMGLRLGTVDIDPARRL